MTKGQLYNAHGKYVWCSEKSRLSAAVLGVILVTSLLSTAAAMAAASWKSKLRLATDEVLKDSAERSLAGATGRHLVH